MSKNFYRPSGMGSGTEFNSWKNGSNKVAIVGVEELTGEKLAKCLAQKSEKRGYQVKALDINLIIEIKKEGYDFSKKVFYTFAFDRNEKGEIITSGSNDGKMDLRSAYKLFDMLLCKPQLGLDVNGKIITEQGKVISSLASLMKTAVKPNDFKYLAIVIKRPYDTYYNAKAICRDDVDSALTLFQQDLDYWMKDIPQDTKKPADTSFDFGDDTPENTEQSKEDEIIFE